MTNAQIELIRNVLRQAYIFGVSVQSESDHCKRAIELYNQLIDSHNAIFKALEAAPIKHLGETDSGFLEVYKSWYGNVRKPVIQDPEERRAYCVACGHLLIDHDAQYGCNESGCQCVARGNDRDR